MPQSSIYYAAARVSVLSKDMLDTSRMERLLATRTLDEAKHTLSEIGWTSADTMDYEQLANAHVKKACSLIRSLTPAPEVTDCFLLQYDIQNLKMLLKARCLNQQAQFLCDYGTMDVEGLTHAVAEHNYAKLPKALKDTMDDIERKLAVTVDPLMIDVMLDKAFYQTVMDSLKKAKAKGAQEYFLAKADITNAIMLLRVRAMGRNESFYKSLLLPFGRIEQAKWEKAFNQPEKIPGLLSIYGKKVTEAAKSAVTHFSNVPGLEKAMDDKLLSIYRAYKIKPFNVEALIGHVLAAQREASCVRLIMAGKANGFSSDVIRERMRELYG